MKLQTALDRAPPTPACFSDRYQWANYLVGCQEAIKKGGLTPFYISNGYVYRATFNFCADCSAGHAAAMRQGGRCHPKQFHGIPIVKAKEASPCS